MHISGSRPVYRLPFQLAFEEASLSNDQLLSGEYSYKMQNNRKESLICLFRLFYFVSCGCIFLYLSQGLYQNFIGSKVILTISDLPIGDSGLMKPVIAICSEDPFRNYSKSMFTLKEYMNNSVNVTNDILMGYSLANFQGDKQPFVYVSNKRNPLFDSCSKISPQICIIGPFVSCII